jgi:hypothetical protein
MSSQISVLCGTSLRDEWREGQCMKHDRVQWTDTGTPFVDTVRVLSWAG